MGSERPDWTVPGHMLADCVRRALEEDVGGGDVTSESVVPLHAECSAAFVSRAPGTVCGMPVVAEVYRQVDPAVALELVAPDGSRVVGGDQIATVRGRARSILTGERVALNFLQHLSGIATVTARYVELAAGRARVVDTRKTAPGLRFLQKYAVRVGGGANHRAGLYDAVLIKDNHIAVCGSIADAVARARAAVPHTMTVTVECDTLEQVDQALDAGADILLLDNMTPSMLTRAVARSAGRAVLEASGGVSEESVSAIAATGVDVVSVGALTHSVRALDIGLDFDPS